MLPSFSLTTPSSADQFFLLSESSFIISGLGYNPQTKKYDASRNVRIRSIELAPNFKVRRRFLPSPLLHTLTALSADPPRLVEHEHECLVEGVHLQASCEEGKEAWVSPLSSVSTPLDVH
jgi:hypothetical protein